MKRPARLWERFTEVHEQHDAPPLTAGSVASMSTPTDGNDPEGGPKAQPVETSGAKDPLVPSGSAPNGQVPDPQTTIAAVVSSPADRAVPRGLQVAASWAWRVILVAALLYGITRILGYLSEVTIPIAIAVLLAAMLAPVANRLISWGLPRGLATAITVLGGLALIAGALTLIISQIVGQASVLSNNVGATLTQLTTWLQNGPLHVSAQYFSTDTWTERLQSFLSDSSSTLTTYATEIGAQVGHFVAGFFITLFSLFYFLYDGRGIFSFLLKFIPLQVRNRVDVAAGKGWRSLSHYVRATVLVALSDAIGVLIAALLIGVPVAPALAALVFIGAFVPLVGAFVSGFVAVAVALVALGFVQALLMLGAIILVMQIEGHLLQPFLLGRAVKLHPLAVLLAIAIGIIVGGIVGALIAVPVLAFTKSFIQYLMGAVDPPVLRLRWPPVGSRPVRPAG